MAKQKGKLSGQSIARQRQKEAAKAKRAEERARQEQIAAAQVEAQKARVQATQTHPWPAPRQSTESHDSYRFLNPYNFVRYLPDPTIAPDDDDARLLGRCVPPPHDRYIGLSGRITCHLAAETPLFISDSHDIKVTKVRLKDGREVEHKSYRFFQYGGRDAIPATSLRGMIRSMFEAVTNSPFSVFNGEERLEYRIDLAEARHFKPGIVESLPQDGQPGVIALCEEAKVGAYYKDPAANLLDESWRCGEEAYAIVGKTKNNVPIVTMIARSHAALAGDGRPVHRGWVKVTGQTIDTKCNESFFYFKNDPAQARKVHFSCERAEDFNAILHAQLHERKEDFHTQVQSTHLSPDDLVYVELDPDDTTQVRNIALARVARLCYRNAIGDLLPEHLRSSERYEELDIASRVFGWVKAEQAEDRKARVAYAGRVRFTHAVLTEEGDHGIYADELPLAILGAPKPTTTLFYLRKKRGDWSEDERKQPGAAKTIGYDGPNELRGRKVYRHHGAALNRLEYERAGRIRDNQNRSVRGVRAPGNVFEFAIEFHNLAPVEFGALLWTLHLGDEGCFYRLGYAKPLGFGSVRLSVEKISLLDFHHRYLSLSTSGWCTATPSERSNWLARFEQVMERCYGQPLRELTNIKDLLSLLSEPKRTRLLPIHYPRLDVKPDPEGKNFSWFVANKAKSTKPKKAGPNATLETPGNEQGFLLEKGEIP
ncbi:MAG: TIGR03986 family CRISPR-associated RAMP protein [Caldilinea sp.]